MDASCFWIPFNKPQYHDSATLIDIGSLPDRLQSEMSVSCHSSDYELGLGTSPLMSPVDWPTSKKRRSTSITPPGPSELDLSPAERAKIKILLVEDK
jgi:hypothetical protein